MVKEVDIPVYMFIYRTQKLFDLSSLTFVFGIVYVFNTCKNLAKCVLINTRARTAFI